MREPDASCIAATPPIAFATQSLMVSNLRFSITGDASRFAGTWEAEYPNVPRPFDVQLRAAGSLVTGTWLPNQLALFDGSIKGDTLRFSVKSPDGARTIRFVGTLRGDAIAFVRDVEAPAGGVQGQGIFGTAGLREFVARRSRQ
jgi:hypothetical protein